MTQRVGAKGQVVIPRRLREVKGLTSGVEVAFEDRPDGVLVRAAPHDQQHLRGRYRESGMARKLLADRASEPK